MATASTLFSSISNPKITAENLFCRNASLKTLLCLLAGICCTFSAKFSGSTLQEAMSYAIKNQTNPLTISATGYAPYIEARARKASQKTGPLSQAEKNAQRIRDYWIRQDFANEIEQYAKDHEKDLFRNRWECAADKKGLYSRVQWEMDKINDQMDHELDKRRNRLSELLKSEEDALMKESFAPKEDPESRHERMLSRYKELRMQKEEERVKVAEEKKEQQFKRNCEELRTLMSRKIATEIAEEGRKARYEKMCDAKERDKEEALYADMWLRDAEAKKEKEDRDEKEKKRHDAKYGGYIKDQMQQKRLEKQKVLREKETDAEIRVRSLFCICMDDILIGENYKIC
ncbi:TPH domain-containing protein [Caerostris darwini]|uniref:TPH domain-containing protein n=1 Tax=Caerostris darwini TaxID=1538125 RepID=A0AAV4M5F0_9ARAC|nr:TPH domain-containing protein [Caerostris darwini]